mgnify:CR=1 FL=1
MSKQKQMLFRLNYYPSKGSQSGRMFSYLQKKGSEIKKLECYQAIASYYLVEALNEEGLRDREDLKKIAQRCYTDLISQAEKIAKIAGLDHNVSQALLQQPLKSQLDSEQDEDDDYIDPLEGDGESGDQLPVLDREEMERLLDSDDFK